MPIPGKPPIKPAPPRQAVRSAFNAARPLIQARTARVPQRPVGAKPPGFSPLIGQRPSSAAYPSPYPSYTSSAYGSSGASPDTALPDTPVTAAATVQPVTPRTSPRWGTWIGIAVGVAVLWKMLASRR